MKNFTNNFKQITSRLSARWLIMALMMLVGTSSAWGITIYYDNSQTPSYSKVYLHLGHDSYIKSYEMEFDAETSLYHKSWNQIEWNDAKYIAFTGQAISTEGLENKFTDKISTYYTINMGGLAAISDYLFSSSGANADPISIRIKNILNLNYIGFYIVENDNWNQSSFAAITSESAYGATDVYHSDGSDDGQGYVIGIVYAPSDKYNLTHSASWNNCPKMTSNAELGYAYYITGDHNYNSEEGTAPSCDFSIDNTIKAGETSTKSVTSSGKSKYGTQDYSEDSYYVKKSGETSLTKLEVEGSELQTQSLAVGEYTIYVLLFDGRIYAKGGEQTLTVETACEKPSEPSITINHVSICSRESAIIEAGQIDDAILYSLYKGNNDAPAQTNNTGIFEVSEAASYRVTVTTTCGESRKSSFVTLSKKTGPTASNYVIKDASKSKEYTGSEQTLTAEDITVNNNAGAVASIYFKQDGNTVDPINVGVYEVYVTTVATEDICAGDVMIGTFTITCPAPEAPTFEVTQHEVKCGTESLQKGIIKITNPVSGYKYKLGLLDANTEYTLDGNNSITGVDAGSYRITAIKYCGEDKNSRTNEESYAVVNSSDVKLTPTLEQTPIVKCGEGDNAYTPGTLVITNYNEDYNYAITPGVGTPTIDGTNATYSINAKVATEYTVIATHKEYNCSSVQAKTTVALTNNTPTLEEISISSNVQIVCAGDNNVTLTCNLVNPVGTPSYKWFKNGVEIVGETSNLIPAGTLNENTTFSVAVILDNNGCTKEFNAEKLIEVKVRPESPNLGAEGTAICKGATVDLPMVDQNNNSNQINWYNGNKVNPTNLPVSKTTTFYAEAVSENGLGCPSNDKTPYTVTVNPLPTITEISGNNSAVLYEDVELTATDVTPDAEVKWYLGNNVTPVATGTTYIVTSETAGDVIVKAKAFLNGCESDFKEHKVTFDEENCQGNLSNDIIINFTHPDKDETNKNCQYWGFGKLDYKINGTSQSIDLGKETTGTKTITIENIVASKITDVKFTAHYKFNSCNCEAYTTTIELEKGYKYDVTIEEGDGSGQQSSGSAEKTLVIERSVSLSTQPPLSAPAVKTVSATSVEGSGVVNFVGKVIKTGCAAATKIYVGYQYKLATEPWPNNVTAGDAKGNLIVVPDADGKTLYETYSTTISGLTDGNYVFRAYIINGYNFTNGNYNQGVYYGIDIPVKVSTKKYPIENLKVRYANDRGEVLQDQNVTYCVGDDAYIKLIYEGSRLKPEDDVINISSILENTFTLVEGKADLYTFVVKGNETITVNAKNKENTDNPTAELTINTYAVPVIPSIDIDQTTICSNDPTGAKITVSNPQVDITYQVYRISGESEPTTHVAEKKHSEGVLEFNSMIKAGTYYVRAFNEQCPKAIVQSLDEILTVIDADATSISISPETKTVNPWVPVTFTVTKQGNYDYTFSCKEDGNDVTSNMVINKSGDTYVVKFPKPEGVSAVTDLNGQVTFADKTYKVEVKLNADVQCGTFFDKSDVTLTNLIENCPQP